MRTLATLLFVLFLGLIAAKELRVHIGTWNVNSGSPEYGLEELAGLNNTSPLPDIIVLGFQELTMRPDQALFNKIFSDRWTNELVPQLAKWGYEKVQTVRMVSVLLNVFVNYDNERVVRSVAYNKIPTGFGGVYGNKGGVVLSMTVHNKRLRFVNSHLPAHDEGLSQRIQHYRWIRENMSDPVPADYFFWMGDLNFRIEDFNKSPEMIRGMINRGELDSLLQLDQLKDVMQRDLAFSDFQEQPITFKPTFKLIPGEDEYNMKRRPAWTDRILYKPSDELTPVLYKSLENIKYSDHRPVVAQFLIQV